MLYDCGHNTQHPTLASVSYTHLDVYKRQYISIGIGLFPLKMAVSGTTEKSGFVRNFGPQPNSPGVNFNQNDTSFVSLRTTLRLGHDTTHWCQRLNAYKTYNSANVTSANVLSYSVYISYFTIIDS